ncbi:hypothetical protein V8E54_000298 [Elaphomyces granulatus]
MCAGLIQEWISHLNYYMKGKKAPLVKAVSFGRYLADIVSVISVLTDIVSATFGFHRYRYTDIIVKLWPYANRLDLSKSDADVNPRVWGDLARDQRQSVNREQLVTMESHTGAHVSLTAELALAMEPGADRRRENLPTASEVAAIVPACRLFTRHDEFNTLFRAQRLSSNDTWSTPPPPCGSPEEINPVIKSSPSNTESDGG